VSDSSLEYLINRTPFTIREDTLLLNFDVQDSSLKGLFKFRIEVSDKGLLPNIIHTVRFEVFTAVTMKNGVFWDDTPCGSCKNRCFGGT
jgi:hypothetical protein